MTPNSASVALRLSSASLCLLGLLGLLGLLTACGSSAPEAGRGGVNAGRQAGGVSGSVSGGNASNLSAGSAGQSSAGGAAAAAGSSAAAGGDVGGTSGAPGSSGGGGGPGRGCGASTYLLCEDFEAAQLGATPEGWTKHGEASSVADDQAKHGKQSLKLGAVSASERRIYHDASGLGSQHWGRVFYKVALPVPEAFVHSTLVALSGTGPTIGAAEFRVVDTVKKSGANASHQFLYNVQPKNGSEFGSGTDYDWSFDGAWHCAEWHIDSSDQSFHFYLDGAEQLGFAKGAGNYSGSEIPDSFDELKIGWVNYQQSPPGFTAWLDDLAVDDVRVGCGD